MNSIPLIKGNTPQEINTSIIALKKALSELEAQDRLLQGADKDVQDKIKQINELIEGINTHLGTVDTHLSTIDGQITALQPVDTVTSGNMHSVTSNAVAGAVATNRFLIPLDTTFRTTSSALTQFTLIGSEFRNYYDQIPTIAGKTKKLKLLFNIFTASSNAIIVGIRNINQSPLPDPTEIYRDVVWGGATAGSFSKLVSVPVDPSYINPYTQITFVSSDANFVSIGFMFAEVYFE